MLPLSYSIQYFNLRCFTLKLMTCVCVCAGCEDCQKSHEGDCEEHGPLRRVADTEVSTRARRSLPHILELRDTDDHTGKYGFVKSPSFYTVSSKTLVVSYRIDYLKFSSI